MNLKFLPWILLLYFVHCSPDSTTLNGVNEKEFEASIIAMEHELPSDQAPKLREAIELVYRFDTHQDTDALRASRTRHILNMKNADEVFTIAERVAQKNSIDWDRNSLGLLDFTKIKVSEKAEIDTAATKSLKNAQYLEVSVKPMDQNRDGINDALMVFPQLQDADRKELLFENADLNGTFKVFSNQSMVFSKNIQIAHSNMGNPRLSRGVVLPYSAFDAERISGDPMDVSIQIVSPYRVFASEKNNIPTDFQKYVDQIRVDQEAIDKEREIISTTVYQFLEYVGNGELQKAHELSVNPEWRNFENFSSKEIGFGAVENVQIESIKTKNYDPQKEKAQVLAKYTFTMEGGLPLPLTKVFSVQKVAGSWKIVDSKKV